jgi:hypothetical protein
VKFSLNPLRLVAIGSAAVLLGSCTEKLESSGVCAVLCPSLGGAVQNVTIDAVTFDTTVQALSGLGAEDRLLLATRGDTLDARVIIRFDSLPRAYHVAGAETPIDFVDSVSLRLVVDTLTIKGAELVTIEAYDVDTTADDTSTAAVLTLFRPDRLISSQTFTAAELRDTIRYVLPNAHVLAKIETEQRLRLGLRAVSAVSSQFLMPSTEAGAPTRLRFRVAADTAVQPITLAPLSKTPTDDAIVAGNLRDYTVFARRPPPGSASDLEVGGFPPRRAYFRFDIPAILLDSSTVIRATLLLNQLPNALLDPNDSVLVIPNVVMAGVAVGDPTKAAQIFADVGLDTLRTTAGDSGLKLVELGRAFVVWRGFKASETPRAIVLRTNNEGKSPLEVRFSSLEAVAALRPRLRISYTTDVPLGLP